MENNRFEENLLFPNRLVLALLTCADPRSRVFPHTIAKDDQRQELKQQKKKKEKRKQSAKLKIYFVFFFFRKVVKRK